MTWPSWIRAVLSDVRDALLLGAMNVVLLPHRAWTALDAIVRTFVPVVAGAAHMRYRVFAAYNLLGALLWGVGVTLLGFWLGQYEWVGKNIDVIFIVIVLISVIPIGLELLKAGRRKATEG